MKNIKRRHAHVPLDFWFFFLRAMSVRYVYVCGIIMDECASQNKAAFCRNFGCCLTNDVCMMVCGSMGCYLYKIVAGWAEIDSGFPTQKRVLM